MEAATHGLQDPYMPFTVNGRKRDAPAADNSKNQIYDSPFGDVSPSADYKENLKEVPS